MHLCLSQRHVWEKIARWFFKNVIFQTVMTSEYEGRLDPLSKRPNKKVMAIR